jgi:hypothetical protein
VIIADTAIGPAKGLTRWLIRIVVASGWSHPHAVNSISGGVISTTFTCDPNGNELTGNGRATTWTSYNKPASITQGSSTISFLDDPDHQRFQQVTLRCPGRACLAEPVAE